jgi:hypothetical protein
MRQNVPTKPYSTGTEHNPKAKVRVIETKVSIKRRARRRGVLAAIVAGFECRELGLSLAYQQENKTLGTGQ